MLLKARPNLHDPLPDGRTIPSVTVDRLYVAVTVANQEFRIVDDSGEPILVPRDRFDILDDWIPSNWDRIEDGDWWSRCPLECSSPGFFERWHDGFEKERECFAKVYMSLWYHYEHRLDGQALVLKCRPN